MNAYLEKDYKKWILFNHQLKEFQKLYELYISVESKEEREGVSMKQTDNMDGIGWIIQQEGYEVSLEIEDEKGRKELLNYLVQHYFPDEEIEDWYQAKLDAKNKKENHELVSNRDHSNTSIDFKVHPKESLYYKFRVFFSICFYGFILFQFIDLFFSSVFSGILGLLILAGGILLFGLLRVVVQGLFIGWIKGSSVKLNEHQYSEVYKIVKDHSDLVGLKETPEVYVTYGHFNAFVTKLARKKFLVLHSEVLETVAKGDFEVLKFVVGHELGHIKRRHLSREKWLFPSLFIPFLKQAHSRGCEYTCDRIGYHYSPKGAMEGILILAAGKSIYSKINMARYVEDSNSENGFWVKLSEKFLSHPHTFKRMTALRNYAERGY